MEKKKAKRWKKVLLTIVIILAAAAVGIFLFLKLWPPFGAVPSAEDKQNYAERAENYDGNTFSNEHDFSVMEAIPKGAEDHILSEKGKTPEDTIPTETPELEENRAIDEVAVTWFGHSSLLLQMHGKNILIDPVFSEISSPVSFIGNKRFSEIPMKVEDLPEIDIVILSHDHYDHLDYSTIRALDEKVNQYIVPLGVENPLERWGVDGGKITNMAWWEETEIDGLTIGCTPARHYSGRSQNDRFTSLWASWVIRDEYHSVYESGDSGFDTHYEKIHDKYGDFDLVLLDCAQYSLRWPSVHQNPEEAFAAAEILGAKCAMPIHWGAFRLSSHPWDDPAVRFVKAAENSDILVSTPLIGQTMKLSEAADYQTRWYEVVR